MQQNLPIDLGPVKKIESPKATKKRRKRRKRSKQLTFEDTKQKDRFTRQKVVSFFQRRYGEVKGKEMAKRYRRLKKYKNLGQYKKGTFYCKEGLPITDDRVSQYDNMCHKKVRSYFPALALYEKSYNYDDLVVECRREVFLAILDGFDPRLALTCPSIKDPEKRKRAEHKKRLNRKKTLQESEKNIVWGRLDNFCRRERWKNLPSQKGGRTELLDQYVTEEKPHRKEFQRGLYSEMGYPEEVRLIKDRMMQILEDKGLEDVLGIYNSLDDDTAEMVVELLTQGSVNPLSKIIGDESELYNNKEEQK